MGGEKQGGEGGGRVAGTCSGTDLLRRLDQLSQHEEQQAGWQAGRTAVRGWLTDPGALHCNWPDHLQDWGCSVRHHPIIILGIFFKATYP